MGMSWERMLALKGEYEKAERVDVKLEGFEGKKPDLVIKNNDKFKTLEHFTVPSLSSQDYPTKTDSITYSYVIGNTIYDNPNEPILFLFYNGSLFVKIFGQSYPFQQMAIPAFQNGILFTYEEKDAEGKYKYYPALYDGKDKIYLLQKEGMQLVYQLYPSSYQALINNTHTINLETTPTSMCFYNGELYYTVKGNREYSYPSGYVYTDYFLYKYDFETNTSTLALNFTQELGGVFGHDEEMIYYGRGLYLLVCNEELYCYGTYSDSNALKNNLFLTKINLVNKEYSLIANVPLGDTFSAKSYSYLFPEQFQSDSHFNPLFAYDQKIYGKNFCYDTVTGQTSTEEQFYVRNSYKTNEDKTIRELTRANISVTETNTELQIKMQEKDLETGDIASKDIANLKKPTYKDFTLATGLKTFFPIVLKESTTESNPNYNGNPEEEPPYITKTKDRLYIVRENRIFKVLRGKMIEMNQAPGPYLIPYRNRIHCFTSGDGNSLSLYGHPAPEAVAGHYVLNSNSGKWEVIGNLPIVTYGTYTATCAITTGNYGTGIVVYKDEIHILSGASYGYSGTSGRHWIYNDETGWRKGSDTDVDLNNARMRTPYLFVYQNKLYGMNGEGNGSNNGLTFVYDDENNKFVQIDRDPLVTKYESSGYCISYGNIISYYYGNFYGNYPSRFFEYKEKLYLMNNGILYLVKDFPEKKLEETLLIPIYNFYEDMVETSDKKDPITISANYSMSTNGYDFDNMFKGRVPFVYQDKVCVLITDEDDFYVCQVKIDEADEDVSQSDLVIE